VGQDHVPGEFVAGLSHEVTQHQEL
jgi:hypothetical protein